VNLGRDDPAHFEAREGTGHRFPPEFNARGEGSAPQRRRRVQARSAPELTRAAM
jgi:hypothetical protein